MLWFDDYMKNKLTCSNAWLFWCFYSVLKSSYMSFWCFDVEWPFGLIKTIYVHVCMLIVSYRFWILCISRFTRLLLFLKASKCIDECMWLVWIDLRPLFWVLVHFIDFSSFCVSRFNNHPKKIALGL
jgi:hypothetical protein